METLPIQHHIEICEHGVDCKTCCWPWTACISRSGYGRTKAMCYGHVETYAHRIMWAYHHQSRVPNHMIVNHACNNKLCCNPTHLELLTYSQHKMKMRKQRDDWGHVKLTEEQVSWILAMGRARKKTQEQIAKEVGVSQVNISNILRGRTWQHLQSENRKSAAREWVASQIG